MQVLTALIRGAVTQRYVLFPGKLQVGKHGAPPLNQQEHKLFFAGSMGVPRAYLLAIFQETIHIAVSLLL